MKKFIAVAAISTMALSASAGTGEEKKANASQTVKLSMSNAIEITFKATGSETGNVVGLEFNTVNDYANGVESKPSILVVRSNKDFSVAVNTKGEKFSYSGRTEPSPVMPVKGVLNLMISENNTGGKVAAPFSEKSYSSLSAGEQKLIVDGSRGGKQSFGVQYKATPGFEFPAGTYSVDVVYTATQQ